MAPPVPPSVPPPPAGAAPVRGLRLWHAGRQLLIYQPDGPVGGTFTCTRCAAQAWQPDLLPHAPGCPFGPPPQPVTGR